MKKLFIIALSIFALIAFTTPSIAGQANAWNLQDSEIYSAALAGFGGTGAALYMSYDENFGEGGVYGYNYYDWWNGSASASEGTFTAYGYIDGVVTGNGFSVVSAEGDFGQMTYGDTGWYGGFDAYAYADQSAFILTGSIHGLGVSTMSNDAWVDADANTNDYWYWYGDGVATADAFSNIHTEFHTANVANGGLDFTIHNGYANSNVFIDVAAYDGYYYYGGNIGGDAYAYNNGGIVTGFSADTHGVTNSMNMSGAMASESGASIGFYSNGGYYNYTGGAHADMSMNYEQQQVTPNGFQYQSGFTNTSVTVGTWGN